MTCNICRHSSSSINKIFTFQVMWAEQQHEKIRVKRGHFHDRMIARGIVPRFNDPLWDAQWYLVCNNIDNFIDWNENSHNI